MKTTTNPIALEIKKILVAVDVGGISDGAITRGRELRAAFGAELEEVHVVAPVPEGAALRPAGIGAHGQHVLTLQGDPGRALVARARDTHVDLLVLGGMRRRGRLDFGSTAREIYGKAPCSIWMQPPEMVRLRSLVVAVDDSAESRQALANAIDLAKRLQARVRAIHVYDFSPYSSDDRLEESSFDALQDLGQTASAQFERGMEEVDWRGLDHTCEFLTGNVMNRLREALATADLLVLGSRARSRLASTALGSVAYSVLAHAEKPVWIVRGPSE